MLVFGLVDLYLKLKVNRPLLQKGDFAVWTTRNQMCNVRSDSNAPFKQYQT